MNPFDLLVSEPIAEWSGIPIVNVDGELMSVNSLTNALYVVTSLANKNILLLHSHAQSCHAFISVKKREMHIVGTKTS